MKKEDLVKLGVQGQPAGIQGQPAGVQGQPAWVQGQPAWVQGQPAGVQGQPAGVQGQPAGVQGQPAGVQGQPAWVQGQPAWVQGQPAGVQGQPAGDKIISLFFERRVHWLLCLIRSSSIPFSANFSTIMRKSQYPSPKTTRLGTAVITLLLFNPSVIFLKFQ